MASDTQTGGDLTPEEERALEEALVRVNEHAWGIALGLLCGLGLFLATAILVLRGGPVVGPHLSLLGIYLPGFRVTWTGACIGLAYGLAGGYVTGLIIGAVYNRLVTLH
ncbi:MAG TPA: hypothetical protein VNK41_05860 [Vicinamibacterales bacterium]|nr:hypothetical protein [Vicinamibacterales bacterium]